MFVFQQALKVFSQLTWYLSCQDSVIISCGHPDTPLKKGPHKGSIFTLQGLIKSSYFWGGYIGQAMILCYAAATEMLKTNTPPPKKKRENGKKAIETWNNHIFGSKRVPPTWFLTPTNAVSKLADSKHPLRVPPVYKNLKKPGPGPSTKITPSQI